MKFNVLQSSGLLPAVSLHENVFDEILTHTRLFSFFCSSSPIDSLQVWSSRARLIGHQPTPHHYGLIHGLSLSPSSDVIGYCSLPPAKGRPGPTQPWCCSNPKIHNSTHPHVNASSPKQTTRNTQILWRRQQSGSFFFLVIQGTRYFSVMNAIQEENTSDKLKSSLASRGLAITETKQQNPDGGQDHYWSYGSSDRSPSFVFQPHPEYYPFYTIIPDPVVTFLLKPRQNLIHWRLNLRCASFSLNSLSVQCVLWPQ